MICQLKQLNSLNIGYCSVEDIAPLGQLKDLTCLNINHIPIGLEGLKIIGENLQQLKSLDVTNCGITNEAAQYIRQLNNLESLTITFVFYQKCLKGVEALSEMKQLKSLNIGNSSDIGGPQGAKLISSLYNLTSLRMDGTMIEDEGARFISELKHLRFLDLTGNNISDEGAKSISGLKHVTDLDMARNDIGDEGAKAIATMNQLKRLILDNNKIGDDGAQYIGKLPQLRSLAVCGNRITPVSIQNLRMSFSPPFGFMAFNQSY
ncbi:predicted protein [Naegleria gruberi]|uniref:Predicted protein n=1 Tax=Naegleria gruberi TaxID=5762 RepID=D2VDM3_NAEGR|nr:uncharacterized protein NAEGRDRAFT_66971 [Naegleria gruberi]EFC44922.1 predicted protein [Naegleria gruberi]|eukprot:XP_002677666.1 predicted protein [Naegleria gruberi strain NEG-M]